jgi:hypothetical protein
MALTKLTLGPCERQMVTESIGTLEEKSKVRGVVLLENEEQQGNYRLQGRLYWSRERQKHSEPEHRA